MSYCGVSAKNLLFAQNSFSRLDSGILFPVNLLFSSFCFSGEKSPALPPKRKSMLVSNPTINGAEIGDESKVFPPPASEDNLPALPPKKSVSRMSAEVNGPPVPGKPKVRKKVNFRQRHDGLSQLHMPVVVVVFFFLPASNS